MRWLAFLCFLTLPLGLIAADINGVRTSHERDRTRVVFDLSDAADYRVFTMRKPERVVIDFSRSTIRGRLRLPARLGKTVKRIRHAKRGSDGVRVVLDLAHGVNVSAQKLVPGSDHGHRVVVDLQTLKTAPGVASNRTKAATPKPVTQAKPVADAKVTGLRDVVVAIDAGHGGADVGAIGQLGFMKKTSLWRWHVILPR